MGLLNFLFGIAKQTKGSVRQTQNHAYNQGYHDGYRDSYEDYACECEDVAGDCLYGHEYEEHSEYDDCDCGYGYGEHDCGCDDNDGEEW